MEGCTRTSDVNAAFVAREVVVVHYHEITSHADTSQHQSFALLSLIIDVWMCKHVPSFDVCDRTFTHAVVDHPIGGIGDHLSQTLWWMVSMCWQKEEIQSQGRLFGTSMPIQSLQTRLWVHITEQKPSFAEASPRIGCNKVAPWSHQHVPVNHSHSEAVLHGVCLI